MSSPNDPVAVAVAKRDREWLEALAKEHHACVRMDDHVDAIDALDNVAKLMGLGEQYAALLAEGKD